MRRAPRKTELKIRRTLSDFEQLIETLSFPDVYVVGSYPLWQVLPWIPNWEPKDLDVCVTDEGVENKILDAFPHAYRVDKSDTAISIQHSFKPTVQILTTRIGAPSDVVDGFDLSCCRLFRYNNKVRRGKTLNLNEVTVDNVRCILHTVLRVLKYQQRGFVIDPISLVNAIHLAGKVDFDQLLRAQSKLGSS